MIKKDLNKNIQNLCIWGIIFFAVLVSYYLWDDIKISMHKENYKYIIKNENSITIEKFEDGHFYLPLINICNFFLPKTLLRTNVPIFSK